MILADPGNLLHADRGSRRSAVVELSDIMPTLLDAAGLAVPDALDGHSLLPVIHREKESVRPWLHGEHTMGDLSSHWIIEGPLKYVWFSQSGREQLFDLSSDATERTDYRSDPEHQGALLRLRSLLIRILYERGDGYSDGTHLVTGKTPTAVLPFLDCETTGSSRSKRN
jgi:arylsulfatase A-like enzyme